MRVLKQPPGRLDFDEHDARVGQVRTLGEHTQDLPPGSLRDVVYSLVMWRHPAGNTGTLSFFYHYG